ncbi:MAG TPA: hypothetical protein DCP08_00985 [Chloroflexi bacterium]|nr:hypothetical protein [Chloroflexota bacterium]
MGGSPTRDVRKGDALRYAQEALSSGYESVIVAGGDGTVNEVVNGSVGAIIPEIETDLLQRVAKR